MSLYECLSLVCEHRSAVGDEADVPCGSTQHPAPVRCVAFEFRMDENGGVGAGGVVFVTGYPGFIGKRLVQQLVSRGRTVVCLIEERFRDAATAHMAPLPAGSVRLVAGDITDSALGLDPKTRNSLRKSVTDVYHLAAIYNLSVPAEVGERINVGGTAHVLDFCASLSKLHCLSYVSTCYVSGDRTGLVFEDELDKGQGFKNHYEETKFRAEVLVRERLGEVPAVILRPAIVVGDSRTGETDKFDGPYVTFAAIRKGLMLLTPGSGEVPLNLVPVDFVIDCMVTIPEIEGTIGKTFQLADPDPLTVIEVVRLACDRFGVRRPMASYPLWMLEAALSLRSVRELVGVPQQTVAYFNHAVVYDSKNTQDALRGTSIRCPLLKSYLNNILRFYLNLK